MNEMEILIYPAVFDDETETPPSTLTNLSSSPYIICILKNLKKWKFNIKYASKYMHKHHNNNGEIWLFNIRIIH